MDPTRNALMDSLRTTGGKRGLRSVPRREKKESDFMAVLRREQGMQRTGQASGRPAMAKSKSGAATKAPTGQAHMAKKAKSSPSAPSKTKTAEKPRDIVKSSFCAPDITLEKLPPLGPATTDDELNALFDQIDKEIDIDPELTLDLLDILYDDEGEEIDEGEEEYHGDGAELERYHIAAVPTKEPLKI